jgi:hypothetical protein
MHAAQDSRLVHFPHDILEARELVRVVPVTALVTV